MTDAPRFAFATHELALVARDLRDARATGDPKMVDEGKLSAAAAADRLRIADALATDWTCFDEMRLPPEGGATDAEKLAMLERALTVIIDVRDKARTAMVAEGAWHGVDRMTRGALWQLVDAHLPQTARIAAWLHWESYAAAVEALLWWQRRTGTASKRWIVEANLAMRAAEADAGARAAA